MGRFLGNVDFPGFLLFGFYYIIKKGALGLGRMKVRVNGNDNINQHIHKVDPPEGYSAPGFFATTFDKVVGLARKNSIWPLPFATSCCGIEFMATMGAHYDLGAFWLRTAEFQSAAGRPADGDGNHRKKNGPGSTAGICPDG